MKPTTTPLPKRYSSIAVPSLVHVLLALALLAAPASAKKSKKEKEEVTRAVLAAQVLGTEEQPLAKASVRLEAPDGTVLLDGRTDKEGRFEIEIESPAGPYLLSLAHEGYAPFSTDLDLEPQQRYDYTFKLFDAESAKSQEAVNAFNEAAERYKAGDNDAARAGFERARELDPSLAPPYLALADLYLGAQALDDAVAAIERYLELEPDDMRGKRLAYQIFATRGDGERARAQLEALRGTEHARPLAQRIYNEGVAALRDGDQAQAIERFELSIWMDETLTEPLVGLVSLRYNAGEYEAVRALLEKLEALDPGNEKALRLRYLLHDALAETEAAMAAFEAYQAVAPNDAAELLYERAELDFKAGDAAAAKRALLRIVELAPELARAHYTLGLVYASNGDGAQARTHLERFLELAPDDPEAAAAREMLPHLK